MTSPHDMRGKEALRDPAIADAATAWFVRQQADDMTGDHWLAFSDWLAEDERHAAAFDAVIAADGKLGEFDPDVLGIGRVAASDSEPAARGRVAWFALPVAAALAGVLAFALWPRATAPEIEHFATAPGETRSLALDDTIRLEINGDTDLSVTRGEAPVVRVAQGEVAFFIASPTPSRLKVEVGGLTLTDKGTTFDVVTDEYGTRIAVGSGRVGVSSPRISADLGAGEQLVTTPDGRARIVHFAARDMASWRSGQLSYAEAPLAVVAADLSRTLGTRVTVSEDLAGRRFTGALPTGGDPAAAVRRAAALMDARARPKDDGWEIAPR